jgi:hypothetical protein
MTTLLTFLKALPLKLLGILVALAICFIGGCHHGESTVAEKWNVERAETADAMQQLMKKQEQVTTQVVTQYIDRIHTVHEKGKDIIKELNVYVPSATACDLPGGFRVFHDAAVQGELPDPARIADAPAATAQDVATTVADNYTTYHDVAEQLTALQAWVNAQEHVNK